MMKEKKIVLTNCRQKFKILMSMQIALAVRQYQLYGVGAVDNKPFTN